MLKKYPTNCGDNTCASCVEVDGFIYLGHHAGGFEKDDAVYQAMRAFEGMENTLEQAGDSLNDMIKIHLYLRDLSDFREVRDLFRDVFGDNPPARMISTTEL
jgi:2-iminobutanoate/2-iminopropanoate deaminase